MKKIGAVFFLSLLLLLTGCFDAGLFSKNIVIEGIVYHENSNISLDNAKVTIGIGNKDYSCIVGKDGSFNLYETTKYKNGTITIEREGYETFHEKLKLSNFTHSNNVKAFYLKPNKKNQKHTLVSGWIDFALPMVTSTTRSRITQQPFDPIIDVREAEPQELIIYPFEYNQAIAQELYQEFHAIDMRLRPELGMIILKFPVDYDLESILEDIEFHPEVLEAYINYPVFALGMPLTPNDPNYHLQWNIPTIYLPEAWAITTGDRNIRVAVLDTKVYSHEDLNANLYLDEIFDFIGTGIPPQNTEKRFVSHGTHVAGILGAVTDNGIGVAGTMWDVEIIPIRVLADGGGGGLDALIAGIYHASELDVDIINLSLGIDQDLKPLSDAIQKAYNQGIIIVAAAGNKPPNMKYPAQYQEVIAVGATSINHEITWYSAYEGVKLFAPGGDGDEYNTKTQILSTDIKSFDTPYQYDYKYVSGTSMAAPHVSGIIGLILSAHNKNYTSEEISELLWQTGIIFDINNPEQRLVNAYAAITESYVQNTIVEFTSLTSEESYHLTDIDNLRHFYQFLPPDEYLVKAHLDVDHNGILNSGDWYVEQELSVEPNTHINNFILRMEIYP